MDKIISEIKKMKQLCLVDVKNYDSIEEEICRVAARGIILKGDKILLTHGSFYNDYKIPGGGIDQGETIIDALIREVHEETGYNLVKDSIIPFGYYEEKRKGIKEEKIFHQYSSYFFCDVTDFVDEPEPTESEIRLGYKPLWININDAIIANSKLTELCYPGTWINRERIILEMVVKEKNIY